MSNAPPELIVIGAGGHAKVLIDTLRLMSLNVTGLTDNDSRQLGYDHVLGVPVLGGDSELSGLAPDMVLLVNGIGGIRADKLRKSVFEHFKAKGFRFINVIHPSAVVSVECSLGEGVQIMAGALIQPGCKVGDDTIINTGAALDHDCILGCHVHLAPGATLSGFVSVDDCAHIGTGANVIQQVKIGAGSTVAAGATVINDVPAGVTVAGVPAGVIGQGDI